MEGVGAKVSVASSKVRLLEQVLAMVRNHCGETIDFFVFYLDSASKLHFESAKGFQSRIGILDFVFLRFIMIK